MFAWLKRLFERSPGMTRHNYPRSVEASARDMVEAVEVLMHWGNETGHFQHTREEEIRYMEELQEAQDPSHSGGGLVRDNALGYMNHNGIFTRFWISRESAALPPRELAKKLEQWFSDLPAEHQPRGGQFAVRMHCALIREGLVALREREGNDGYFIDMNIGKILATCRA